MYNDKRIVVMGLGRFGGGVGVARFLAARRARVLVTDLLPADKLAASLAQLADLPMDYRLGEHVMADFTSADLIVVNPAVDARANPYLQAAADAGVPATSEIRLLLQHLPNRERIIGITGTAGKSTVTAMIGHVLRKAYGVEREANIAPAPRTTHHAPHIFIGGNLGGSLLDKLDTMRPEDWIVLELSSFMLEGLALDRFSPHIAVLTNITPNHLDRHGTFEAYARIKQTIFEYQRPQDFAIVGPVDPRLVHPRTTRVIWYDGLPTYNARPPLQLAIPGEHNQINATVAIEAAVCCGIERFAAAEALSDFAGLPHRMQFVAERAGVRYFNDSKATTPEAVMLAIESFPPGKLHIILGGYDKGSDLAAMAQLAARCARVIYTIGHTGERIAELAAQAGGECEIVRCDTLQRALAQTVHRVHEGDAVVLSPGCASYDQFENFEDRGRAFVEAVLQYTGEGAAAPHG